jgi:hypothetical protein
MASRFVTSLDVEDVAGNKQQSRSSKVRLPWTHAIARTLWPVDHGSGATRRVQLAPSWHARGA